MAGITTSVRINDGFTSPLNNMNKAVDTVTNSLGNMRAELNKPVDMSGFATATTKQRELNQELNDGESKAEGLMGKLKGLAIAYAGWQAFTGIIHMSDEMTNIRSRLDLMNDGMQSTDELMNKIHQSANASIAPLKDMADLVGKLGLTAADAFNSNNEMIAFAEQLNKLMVIGGTSEMGKQSVMLQMSQAMSAGVLRGQEFRSVMENAAPAVGAIAKYLGVSQGEVKALADSGKLTADVVKNALLKAAEDTNAKFDEMANTFSDVWTIAKNNAIMAFTDVWKKLSEISSGDTLKNLANAITPVVQTIGAALSAIISSIVWVVDLVSWFVNVIRENAQYIAPIIWIVVPALWAVATAMTAQAVAAGIMKLKMLASAAATGIMTIAQHGLNTAMMMCPLAWIVAGLIAIITVAYIVVEAFNSIGGTSYSMMDLVVKCVNAMARAFVSAINICIDAWNGFIDMLPDEMAVALGGKASHVSFREWKGFGSSSASKVASKVGGSNSKAKLSALANAGGGSGKGGHGKSTADNTKRTADNTEHLKSMEEEIKYLREIGEREAINRFTTAEIKFDMQNTNNLSSNMDVNGFINQLADGLRDAMVVAAEGVGF